VVASSLALRCWSGKYSHSAENQDPNHRYPCPQIQLQFPDDYARKDAECPVECARYATVYIE